MINKEKNFISVVLYIHNEEKNIVYFLETIIDLLNIYFDKYEIICVDDCSSDHSTDVLRTYCEKNVLVQTVSLIHMSMYQGLELSMNAGVDLAIGDFIYEFDSIAIDYDSTLIYEVYKKALEGGYDIVGASPGKGHLLSSKIFYSIYNAGTGGRAGLCSETFRLLSRRAINRSTSLNKTLTYRKAVYQSCGLKYTDIVYDNQKIDRQGFSNPEKRLRLNTGIDALLLFTDILSKIVFAVTILFLCFTIGIGIYTFCVYLSPHDPVEGWTMLMIFLSCSFTGMFLIFTIILKYLSTIVDMIFKKQNYLVESIEKIK